MWWIERSVEWITENRELCIAFAVTVLALQIFAVIGILTNSAGVYSAFACIFGGCFGIAVLVLELSPYLAALGLGVFAIVAGLGYLTVFSAVSLRRRSRERRARRAEIARRLQYTLPDRENSYIRARLNTVLQVPEERDYKRSDGGEPARLDYARKLLARVKSEPLSAAERLQAEDIGKTFALYLQKPRWDSADLRVVNDTFACLLKLSAKYAVAV